MSTKIAILGFGVEGQDAVRYFYDKDVEITVFDKKEKEELRTSPLARTLNPLDLKFTIQDSRIRGIEWVLGKNYLDGGLKDFNVVVRSPGFYRYHPKIVEAEKTGVEITSTTKIFFGECRAPIAGITGTEGKGTTARMLQLALEKAGLKTVLAGNIGKPVLTLLPQANKADWVILELSSFQTIDLHKSPKIAVVTNITVDHLDWHKDKDEYVRAKAQLWKNQGRGDFLILNREDATSRKLAKSANGKVVWFSKKKRPKGTQETLKVPGSHNLSNALAAWTAAKAAGADSHVAWQAIASYRGSEHRLEKVAEIDGVLYINDSASTNPQATIAALEAYKQEKILIAGGSSKGLKFGKMAHAIASAGVKLVLLMGDTSFEIESAIKKTPYKGRVESGFSDMADVVKRAVQIAKRGNVVLLSPGSASFGMFDNFEDRGRKFKQAVKAEKLGCL